MNVQIINAKKIQSIINEDGRYTASLWQKYGKVRLYISYQTSSGNIKDCGHIAIGVDGTNYQNITKDSVKTPIRELLSRIELQKDIVSPVNKRRSIDELDELDEQFEESTQLINSLETSRELG